MEYVDMRTVTSRGNEYCIAYYSHAHINTSLKDGLTEMTL